MWTDTTEGRSFIKEVSESVVVEVAPEEMDLFEELLQEYFDHPAPTPPPTSDEALSFGLQAAVAAWTPAIAAALQAVLGHLFGEALAGIQEEGALAIRKRIREALNPEEKPAPAAATPEEPGAADLEPATVSAEALPEPGLEPPPKPTPAKKAMLDFSKGHLAKVKKVAQAEAKKFGLSAKDADRLASVLIGKLALV